MTSLGWIDATQNFQNIDLENDGLSVNGLPLTQDFDLAVYVKGDRKPTAIYSARLVIEYEGAGGATADVDLAVTELDVQSRVALDATEEVEVNVTNNGPDVASGPSRSPALHPLVTRLSSLRTLPTWPTAPHSRTEWDWTAATGTYTIVNWTATVTSVSGDDSDPSNDTATARTRVARR